MAGSDWLRRDSLRSQLMLWLMLPLAVLLAADAVISYHAAFNFANLAYDESLFDTARSLAQQVKTELGRVELDLPEQARAILESDPYDRVFYRVIAPDGIDVAGRHDLPSPKAMPEQRDPVRYYDAQLDGVPVRVAAFSLFDGSGRAQVTVLAAETLVKRKALVKNVLITVLVPQILLIVVSTLLLQFGIRRGLVPLRRLADAVKRRGHHDLSLIDEVHSPEEVRPLAHAINDLMHRLDVALSAQKRFIADAAHQLRTPLAGLSAQTERALGEQSLEEMRPALQQIKSSSKRAARLVNQLLTLARAEPGSDPRHEFVRLDLAQLTRQTTMDWVPVALERGIDLGYSGAEDPVYIEGEQLLLEEMLNNLIDNALRFGRDGGAVTVSLTAMPAAEIQVEDEGPGIPERDRERVFERFYRIPGSTGEGSGLGLAIVREIASAHGASVMIETPASGRGALVRVRFAEPAA